MSWSCKSVIGAGNTGGRAGVRVILPRELLFISAPITLRLEYHCQIPNKPIKVTAEETLSVFNKPGLLPTSLNNICITKLFLMAFTTFIANAIGLFPAYLGTEMNNKLKIKDEDALINYCRRLKIIK